jgi:LysM repeat protein
MLILTGDTPPINPLINTIVTIQTPQVEAPAPTISHTVQAGDTLDKIAKLHDTTWLRLFYKNTDIAHPDKLAVGQVVYIPETHEELAERHFVIETPNIPTQRQNAAVGAVRGSNSPPAGWFPVHQCTWFVWSQRPTGYWNNASEWLWQAQRDGWATGTTPQVGAIAWESNHVSLVIAVDGDMVTVREANYKGYGIISTRTAPASQFRYIY